MMELIKIGKTRGAPDEAEILIPRLRDYVCQLENLYPGIEAWFDKIVKPPLVAGYGDRSAYVVMDGDALVAAMILKFRPQTKSTKICSLRVLNGYEEQGIGTMLFGIAIGQGFPNVYFTAPESLVTFKHKYFESLGFARTGRIKMPEYRKGNDELLYTLRCK